MDKDGFLRVSSAFPMVKVADVNHNTSATLEMIDLAREAGSTLLVLPELGLTGYTCGDLFHQHTLIDAAADALITVAHHTADSGIMVIVGLPLMIDNRLYNCAAACADGRVIAIVPKIHLPNYNEFYEKRWFKSGRGLDTTCRIMGQDVPVRDGLLIEHAGVKIGIELCEDLWTPLPPATRLALAGADIIANLSATDELIGKHDYLVNLIAGQSARLRCCYVYSSAGPGESSTDVVYAGNAIIAEDGNILAKSPRFTEKAQMVTADIDVEHLRHDRMHNDTYYETECVKYPVYASGIDALTPEVPLMRYVDPHPFVPAESAKLDDRCREVTSIQTAGLVQRLRATGCKALTIGISGGLDSTLAVLIAVKAFDRLGIPRHNIHAITMPGFGTTTRTHTNAHTIMERLGVSITEISINDAVARHFSDIGHNPEIKDVTYENCQARERTQILMDYANRVGGMVLGTGDLSELALGWCTYNADHMSMYGVNSSVPKTLVRHLVKWIADRDDDTELRNALYDIIDTPVSPELIPADENGEIAQKTEDLVGPYELHDFFLYHTIRHGSHPRKVLRLALQAFGTTYPTGTIKHWLTTFYRRFFAQQFKRSCLPDGPKTGSITLSPRGDWRMPSDASSAIWRAAVEEL